MEPDSLHKTLGVPSLTCRASSLECMCTPGDTAVNLRLSRTNFKPQMFQRLCCDSFTSAQHVLALQQLHDGGLSGGNQDDAAVFPAAHQPALRGDVHAGGHL